MSTILIIDDEPNIRRMVGALLSAEGFTVREAADGASGAASAIEDEPDAILLDLMMPGEVDGMGTLTRLREKVPDVPVVMMSGRAGLRDEAGRFPLSRETAHARGCVARAAVRARAQARATGGTRPSRRSRHPWTHGRRQSGDASGARAHSACRSDRRARADHWRVWHRKGACRGRHSRRECS